MLVFFLCVYSFLFCRHLSLANTLSCVSARLLELTLTGGLTAVEHVGTVKRDSSQLVISVSAPVVLFVADKAALLER